MRSEGRPVRGRWEAEFGCEPEAARAARRFVASALAAWDLDDLTELATLCTSEVVTNAMRHAGSAFHLAVEARATEVRVEVEDRGEGEPVPLLPDVDAETGRGMWLVAALAARWGCDRPAAGGKVVWFSLTSPALPKR